MNYQFCCNKYGNGTLILSSRGLTGIHFGLRRLGNGVGLLSRSGSRVVGIVRFQLRIQLLLHHVFVLRIRSSHHIIREPSSCPAACPAARESDDCSSFRFGGVTDVHCCGCSGFHSGLPCFRFEPPCFHGNHFLSKRRETFSAQAYSGAQTTCSN